MKAKAMNSDTRIDLDKYATKGEAVVARRLVRIALEAGYSISVNDGEEWTVKRATNRMTILSALATTDNDTLRFQDSGGNNLGFVWLIYGNAPDGSELIADHTANEAMEMLYNKTIGVRS